MRLKLVLIGVLGVSILGLQGCMPGEDGGVTNSPSGSGNPTVDAAECQADQFEGYLWKPAADLDGVALPIGARVLLPNSVATMDHVPSRLNINVGSSGRIERIYCG